MNKLPQGVYTVAEIKYAKYAKQMELEVFNRRLSLSEVIELGRKKKTWQSEIADYFNDCLKTSLWNGKTK